MTSALTPYRPSPLLAATVEDIAEAIDRDPRLKSPHSIRQYKSCLVQFETWKDGREITKSLVEEYASHLQKAGYSPSTIRQHQAAIRWWARTVSDFAEEHLDGESAARIARQAARVITVRDVKGDRPPRGRYLPREEQSALLSACSADPSPAGTRDAAMIAVALSVGLRRDDLTTLEMDNIRNVQEDSCDLVVHGKGDRIDTLYLYNGGFHRLQAWLRVRGMDPGRIFVPVLKNDTVNTHGKLSGEALRLILDNRQIGLGLPEHITWHDFRKTFISALLDAGHDLSTVQKVARHKSPNTTSNVYDIRGEKVKRAAVRTIEIE